MERFELAQSKEEKERIIQEYKEAGFADWKIEMVLNEKRDFDRKFGLNHTFKELSIEEEGKVDELFEKREQLYEEYEEICEVLENILGKEYKVWKKLNKINRKICEIEGHRLEEKSTEIIDEDGYGGLMSFGFTRRCLVCGAQINEKDIKEEDVVVKGTAEPLKRPKIKTKKIKS